MSNSVRKKNDSVKWYHSLSGRAILLIVVLSLVVGISTLALAQISFSEAILYDIRAHSVTLAKAELSCMDSEIVNAKTREILDLYDSLPDEVIESEQDDEYKKNFEPVVDVTFNGLKQAMWDMQHKLGLRNAFIVALDEETNRMIYLIDADMREASFCYPGTWDHYSEEEIHDLVHGVEPDGLMKRLGLDTSYQATITNLEQFGLRCTAGVNMYITDRYTVMLCLDETLDYMTVLSRLFNIRFTFLMIFVVALAALITYFVIKKKITKPLGMMVDAAKKYDEDKKNGISTPNRFSEIDINTSDEIGELVASMKAMEQGLITYEENLKEVTAERERINTELDLATRIQKDSLPSIFPPFPERDDFDIYATMDPAKEVGGDFYDFLMIDDDHLGLVIADVSGKGVPAALLMMVSKTILENTMRRYESPAEVLQAANNMICSNNAEEMFVTVWLGILEISTGRLTASNAGHEKPVIISADGKVELINDKHGFVLGVIEDMIYTDYELTLNPGDKIFVYTDGVVEATDSDNNLFGTERMLEAIEENPTAKPNEVIANVRAAVDRFVGDAEQFDDITMLCVRLEDSRD